MNLTKEQAEERFGPVVYQTLLTSVRAKGQRLYILQRDAAGTELIPHGWVIGDNLIKL